jgi:hypothetical protein
LLVSLALALALAAGCQQLEGVKGNGTIKSETREVEAFERMEAGGAYQLNIKVGAGAVAASGRGVGGGSEGRPRRAVAEAPNKTGGSPKLVIRSDENLLPLVETKVSGDRLVIRTLKSLRPTEGVKVTVATPRLVGLSVGGAVKGKISGVQSERFTLKLSGAGSVDIAGKAGELALSLSGAGRVRARELEAKKATVRSSGAGSVQVFASESLDVNLSGVGSVTYYGKPEQINKSVSGVGSIRAGE